MDQLTASSFDYRSLAPRKRARIRKAATEIKQLAVTQVLCMVEIGRHLREVRAELEHGEFGAWLASEFRWSERGARDYVGFKGNGHAQSTGALTQKWEIQT